MKRIKRILCTLVIVLSVLVLSACKKDYNAITYKRFVEKLGDELNYPITDNTLLYQGVYQRNYTAIKDDVMFIFYEYESADKAKEFMKKNYEDKKYYTYTSKDNYSTVKYSKRGYLYIVQVDNIIISGSSEKDTNKSEIKKVFKELGY